MLSQDTSRKSQAETAGDSGVSAESAGNLNAASPQAALLAEFVQTLSPLLAKLRGNTAALSAEANKELLDGTFSLEELDSRSAALNEIRKELSDTACNLGKTLENDFGKAFGLQLNFSVHELTNRILAVTLLLDALKDKSRAATTTVTIITTLEFELALIERYLHPEFFTRPLEVLFHGFTNGNISSQIAAEKIRTAGVTFEELFSGICEFSHTQIRNGIKINLDIDASVAARPIHEGSVLVSCVFSELLRNAADAMQNGSGMITLCARNGGPNILIEVEDNGPGIPSERLSRIFEPGFTTKPQGTGQGLYLIKESIEQVLGGKLSVKSELGKGTRFSVLLPYRSLT